MARVAAYVPDLLFGSNVVGGLRAAGHEALLCGNRDQLDRWALGADVLIVDLTSDAEARIATVEELELEGTRILAFYSHVDAAMRERARKAGYDLAVPRSRMAREGARLVESLAS